MPGLAREEPATDYNRDVATVIGQSDRDVSRPFFETIGQGGQSPVELESAVNQLRNVADTHVEQAEGFDVPDELETGASQPAADARHARGGLGRSPARSAPRSPRATRPQRAVDQIAAQMQQFLASDVIYDTRVIPFIQEALEERDIEGQDIADSQFLPGPAVAAAVDGRRAARRARRRLGSGAGDEENVAPGLHGHGLVSIAVGDTDAPAGRDREPHPRRVGHRVHRDVRQPGRERGAQRQRPGPHPRRRHEDDHRAPARAEHAAGANAEATIPLTSAPPIGTPVTIEVSVARVPGEEKVDNNRQSYTAIFTR